MAQVLLESQLMKPIAIRVLGFFRELSKVLGVLTHSDESTRGLQANMVLFKAELTFTNRVFWAEGLE